MVLIEPAPPDPTFPRLTRAPFPSYRYVTGLNPHPVAHPQGHLFGVDPPDVTDEAARLRDDWRVSPQYQFGVDLYNYAYWWEAHEVWEGLWRCYGHDDPLRHALQALIQVSAAHLQRHLGHPTGVRALLDRAREHLDLARPTHGTPRQAFGFDIEHWWSASVVPYFDADGACGYPFIKPQ